VSTNIRSGPDFVRVTGARIVGLDRQLDDVLEVTGDSSPARTAASTDTGAPARTVRISVSLADRLPVLAGRAISLIALLVIAGELAWVCLRGVRPRL
jgi:hypothetical protein